MPLSGSLGAVLKGPFLFPSPSAPVPIPRQASGDDDVFRVDEKEKEEVRKRCEEDSSEEGRRGNVTLEEGRGASASEEQGIKPLSDKGNVFLLTWSRRFSQACLK